MQFNYQMLFCKAFHSGKPLTALPTLTGMPAAPSPGAADIPTNAPAVPRNYGSDTQKKSEAVYAPSSWPAILCAVISGLLGSAYFFL